MTTLDNILSATLLSAEQLLSATSVTPYEAIKAELFPPDYKFPTIDTVQVPESITVEGLISKIEEMESNYQKNLIETQINPDKYTVHEPDGYLSILAEVSGENNFVVTEEKQKNYIEYLELINNTDIDSITEENCYDVIKKLGYFFVSAVGKKTVRI